MTQQIHATIRGRVQGVSFRYHTRKNAESIGCTGWVRNNPDGTVECIAQGTEDQLNTLIDFLHQGSPAAQVDRVDIDWQTPAETFEGFRITYHR